MASVAALSGAAASEAKTIHERPGVMDELEWRPAYYVSGSTPPPNDPVRQIVFSFGDDQLFKVVVDYDAQRIAGADLIEAVSAPYGFSSKPAVRTSGLSTSQLEQESGTAMARWGDAECPGVLYRWSCASSFRLIVTSRRLNVLAWTADAQVFGWMCAKNHSEILRDKKRNGRPPERPSGRRDSRTKQHFDYNRKRFVMSGGGR